MKSVCHVPGSFWTPADRAILAAVGRGYTLLADIMPSDPRNLASLQDAADRCRVARELACLDVDDGGA